MGCNLVVLGVLVAYPVIVCYANTFASLQERLATGFVAAEFAVVAFAFAAAVAAAKLVPIVVGGLN